MLDLNTDDPGTFNVLTDWGQMGALMCAQQWT